MIYLIILPIIIVVSLAFLIVFLSKKAGKIPERIGTEDNVQKNEKRGRLLKRIGHFFLSVIEGTAQWLKAFFLGYHNKFDSFLKQVREKRSNLRRELSKKPDNFKEEIFLQDELGISKEKKEEIPTVENNSQIEDNKVEAEETRFAPMVSKEAVLPEPKADAKSKLEELLIERIAADPRDIEAYERLGDYYMERNCHADARECFRHVLKMSPANRRTKLKMRRLERILGK